MLLKGTFYYLTNLSLSQANFALYRKFATIFETLARLYAQKFFINRCVKEEIMPNTILNLSLPRFFNQPAFLSILLLL